MLIVPKAMLFDMDGTITRPLLDFPRLKAELGIGDRPILEALAQLPAGQRAAAEALLHQREDEAAAASELNEGCEALLALLAERGIRSALITRNSRSSAAKIIAKHRLSFDMLITREDGRFKPDPEPLLKACQALRVTPAEAWMIGDGQYDVEAALAAGTPGVWLSHGRARSFAATPWRVVRDLPELTTMLRDCLARQKDAP